MPVNMGMMIPVMQRLQEPSTFHLKVPYAYSEDTLQYAPPGFRFAIDMWRHLCNSTVMTQILNIASSVSTGKPSGADPFCR
ncbi:hypothetical protein LENED_000968 [Lentinula edodes]|uniref:Uncharacterized protein n=1 Tax=Lentinula edodes TaxID=5353 RepID=A0A1Q3DXP3_LENED|nr:hypothetical protein LENED_000968 [Lentinula edodes]